jgi:hypothetical protein
MGGTDYSDSGHYRSNNQRTRATATRCRRRVPPCLPDSKVAKSACPAGTVNEAVPTRPTVRCDNSFGPFYRRVTVASVHAIQYSYLVGALPSDLCYHESSPSRAACARWCCDPQRCSGIVVYKPARLHHHESRADHKRALHQLAHSVFARSNLQVGVARAVKVGH